MSWKDDMEKRETYFLRWLLQHVFSICFWALPSLFFRFICVCRSHVFFLFIWFSFSLALLCDRKWYLFVSLMLFVWCVPDKGYRTLVICFGSFYWYNSSGHVFGFYYLPYWQVDFNEIASLYCRNDHDDTAKLKNWPNSFVWNGQGWIFAPLVCGSFIEKRITQYTEVYKTKRVTVFTLSFIFFSLFSLSVCVRMNFVWKLFILTSHIECFCTKS